jgi:hypothetical protein
MSELVEARGQSGRTVPRAPRAKVGRVRGSTVPRAPPQ